MGRGAALAGVLGLVLSLVVPFVLYRSPGVAELQGGVDDCCCSIEDVHSIDSRVLSHTLSSLARRRFFRLFQVNYERACPFWHEEAECTGDAGDCSICPCPPDEIPEPWRTERERQARADGGAGVAAGDGGVADGDAVHCSAETEASLHTARETPPPWMDVDDDACYVDLVENPEKYTGYGGFNATRIWQAIYKENCLSDECLEARVFYRLISGFHASTTAHITAYFQGADGRWLPNLDMFIWRLGIFPDRLNNIYFNYVFLLRAVAKVAPALRRYQFTTGDAAEDALTHTQIVNMLDEIEAVGACSSTFDESRMFRAAEHGPLRDQFRSKFRNISRIIDCVTCETCKVHAKLQLLGMGTALRILLDEEGPDVHLHRNEVVALVNTLHKFSDSLRIVADMSERAGAREWERALTYSSYGLVPTALFLVAAVLW